MRFDGTHRDDELLGNFLVGFSHGQEMQNFQLALA
jgi:hypothetical protein